MTKARISARSGRICRAHSLRSREQMKDMKDLPLTISRSLSTRTRNHFRSTDSDGRHAAVLILLLEGENEYDVLFTKRTHEVGHHKGQISFPGGAVEAEDESLRETVLREADEEIGLMREDVEILGRIDYNLTLFSNFVVHPFAGVVSYPYDFKINPAEVARLLVVPLHVFHPDNPEYRRDTAEYEGVTYRGVAYEYEGDIIWGATARMMENFMNIVGEKIPLSSIMR